jgi:hypothetical protein
MADLEQKKVYIEGINIYYKLKSKYEANFNKEKNKIANIEGLSWTEKQIEFQKLKKKCVNCNRPVGSTFSTRLDRHEKHLIALCGDRANPCPLNIDINTGITFDLNDMLNEDEISLSKFKKEIIIDKNDLLFGYITSGVAVAKFDEIKENVASTTNLYEYALQNYNNIVNNSEKKEALGKQQIELYENVNTFKSIIKEYKQTENTQLVNDAVDLYVHTMIPKMKDIMKKKYSYSGVEYNEDDNTFHLIQKIVTTGDFELDVGDNGETVVSLKTGVDIGRKKTVAEKAITSAIPGIKTNASVAKKVKAPAKKLMFVNTETERETGKEKDEEKEEKEEKDEEKEEKKEDESGNESNYSSESESESESEKK